MAKPTRSPLLGYNHNVKYRGRIFHVQTEDSGPVNPRLFTHLYYEGTILASKKHEYDPAAPEDVVRTLMQGQHKAILKELKSAVHDARVERFFTTRGETLEAAEAVAADHHALDLDAAPALPTMEVVEATLEPAPADDPVPLPVPVDRSAAVAYGSRPPTQDEPPAHQHARHGRTPLPTPPIVVIPAPGSRRRPTRSPTPAVSSAPVVVQRTVVVGGSSPTAPMQTPVQRTRRPAQAIPYVVKEGSHPLATPPERPASNELPAPHTLAPHATAGPPRTTATQTKGPGGEPLVEKSLDEVILAYLAQGGESDSG